ncbi:hypothetical protein FED16_19135, partial [Acinetobacter baumannii]
QKMPTMNANVLAFNYAVSGGVVSQDINSPKPATVGFKPLVIRSQKTVSQSSETKDQSQQGRRAALLCLGAALFATATSSANAGVIDEYLEKSKANKELNDQKRLATSGANFARAYTVQFGTCTFPYNFTGCQDLAKLKKVPFISDDIELECKGKDKFKCGSNVFWKW